MSQYLRRSRIAGVPLGLIGGLVLALFIITPAFAAVPAVSSVSPSVGPIAGGTVVTITGTGDFTGTTAVTFGGTAASTFSVTDTTHISATSPGHAAGIVDVLVTTPGGTSAVAATDKFTYFAVPTVASLAPPNGVGGTSVVITGTGLLGATSVTFGGLSATSYIVNSDTQITAVAPAHAAGAVNVLVTTPGGTSAAVVFTYNATVPVVTGVSPTAGAVGGGTIVTVTGTGFTGTTGVTFGGTPGTSVTVLGDTSLTVVSPTHAAGAVDVLVTNSAGTSAVVTADKFIYGGPVVTGINPTSGSTAGGVLVTITGSGFTGATAVNFGLTPVTSATLVSDTSITATAPAHAAGAVDVTVTNAAGTSVTSGADLFTYVTGTVPAVTSLSPTGGPVAGGTVVTITGTGLTGATAVSFGGTAATSVTVTSDTSMTATSPAHAAGTVDVLVTTPGGTSTVTTGDKFTYGPAPVVTGISPTSGSSGTVVTITGTGLTGATSVTFGGVAATPTSATDTQVVVTAPSHAGGVVDVLVITPVGTSATVAADHFTYSGSTVTYTLNFRWSLIVWQGRDGMSVTAALRGQESPDNTATNDISSQVTAMFRWNGTAQKWEGFFPGSENVPGAVDFTTLSKNIAYWIAITGPNNVTWTIEQG